jgi:uncharacterized protein (TIGR02001 family)
MRYISVIRRKKHVFSLKEKVFRWRAERFTNRATRVAHPLQIEARLANRTRLCGQGEKATPTRNRKESRMTTTNPLRISLIGTCLTAAVIATPHQAAAQDVEELPPNTGRLSVDASIDWTSKYYFRGIIQEDDGLIIQPGVELGLNLFQGDDFVTSLDVYAGIWNSIHDEQTGAMPGSTVDSWYEADIYTGASITLADRVEVGTVFTIYASPNDAFATINELAFYAGFDDSYLWEDVAWFNGFAPNALIALELHNTAFGPDEGVYLELGIEPSFAFFQEGPLADLTIATPVVLGLSLDDYYDSGMDHDTLGYVSASLLGSMPLPIPSDFGAWTLSGGVEFLFLGCELEAANSDDDFEAIAKIGLSVSY